VTSAVPQPTSPVIAADSKVAPSTPAPAPPLVAPAANAASRSEWYGAPIIIADGVSTLVASVGGVATGGVLTLVGAGTFLLVPPIIHWARGNVAKGFGSLGLRVGMPSGGTLLGGLVGLVASGNCRGEFCGAAGLVLGGLIGGGLGIIGASVVDSAVLAHDSGGQDEPLPPTPSPTNRQAQKPSFTLQPGATWEKGGGRVFLGGTF
jgi:hypothetical protein